MAGGEGGRRLRLFLGGSSGRGVGGGGHCGCGFGRGTGILCGG